MTPLENVIAEIRRLVDTPTEAPESIDGKVTPETAWHRGRNSVRNKLGDLLEQYDMEH